MIFQATVVNVHTYWWFGPLLMVIVLPTTRKAWLRLLRYVATTFTRGYSRE